jgi:hypothetical protein
MMKKVTYHDMINNYNLWLEYVCGNWADRTEEEFENSSYDELLECLIAAFGEENND